MLTSKQLTQLMCRVSCIRSTAFQIRNLDWISLLWKLFWAHRFRFFIGLLWSKFCKIFKAQTRLVCCDTIFFFFYFTYVSDFFVCLFFSSSLSRLHRGIKGCWKIFFATVFVNPINTFTWLSLQQQSKCNSRGALLRNEYIGNTGISCEGFVAKKATILMWSVDGCHPLLSNGALLDASSCVAV